MLLHPGDLEGQLVEGAAAFVGQFVLVTPGGELLHLRQKTLHPLNPVAHDADVGLDAVPLEQQAKPSGLVGDARRESVRSTLLVTPEGDPRPRHRSKVPRAGSGRRGVPIDERHRQA